MESEIKLIGFEDTLDIQSENILCEFYQKSRKGISLPLKQKIAKLFNEFFNIEMLTRDKCVFAQQFRSKQDSKRYIIIQMPCDVALLENSLDF